MKTLDRTSQIVLVCVLLFFGWIAFQWSPEHIQSESEQTSTPTDSTVSTLPTPKSGAYISQYFGKVSINGSTKYSDSLIQSAGFSLKTVSTKKNEWLSYKYENGGYIVIFPESKFSREGNTSQLLDGIFFVNKLGLDQTLLAKSIKISTAKETAILVENGKVRVFALGGDITIPVFGKNEILKKGDGTSLFLSTKQATKYDLMSAVSTKTVDSQTLGWTSTTEAKAFSYITESEKIKNNEIVHLIRLELFGQRQRSAKIPDGMTKIYLYAENKFGSWSQN